MSNSYFSVFIFLLAGFINVMSGQVVWTEPEFPTQLDDVTIFFDANEGNMGLANWAGDVYAHTGVITSNSSSPTDWKYVQGNWGTADANTLMNAEGGGVYSLSYNITDYYGIPMGELVEQMAFVFRNADGSESGRATDGSDIYTEVYPPGMGLFISVVNPEDGDIVVFQGENIPLEFTLSNEADVVITDNGNSIFNGNILTYDVALAPQTLGKHEVLIVANDGVDEIQYEFDYFVIEENASLMDPPVGVRDGVNYVGDDLVFQLYAPGKQHAFFLTSDNDFGVDTEFRMIQATDLGHFWITIPKTDFGQGENIYQYLVDGSIKIADPYSEIVLDPSNDQWVSNDVMNALPDYPEGKTAGMVTVFETEKSDYNWLNNNFEKPPKERLVVYELLMRDFLDDHSYTSLLDTLDYLERLGITAIELMPINEFEGNQSWGYNPSFHMALDKYYGSADQLKAVIDAAHGKGIAVILDVVFNHCFSQSPLAQLYWDPTNFRPASDNPWLNVTPKHPYNVGYDFNHESEGTKEWTKRVLEYWMTEFRIDGFRFDLSKGLTQTNSGNDGNLMSQYDQSRVDIINDYADFIWSIEDDAYVILEHFSENSEESVYVEKGMMVWGNMTFQFAEVAMGYPSGLSGASYKSRFWDKPGLLAYMESHDEERMMYKINQWGNSEGAYDTKEFFTSMQRAAASAVIYFSIPGPKMIWQFGELGYDYSINHCINGSNSENCRLDPKPIRWEYKEHTARQYLLSIYSAMGDLKKKYPTFSTDDFTMNTDGYMKIVKLTHQDMDAISLANFEVESRSVAPEFMNTGTWYEYFSGQEINVTDPNVEIELDPGEFRLYTSQKITPPDGFISDLQDVEMIPISIYPNLIKNESFVFTSGNSVLDVVMIDMHGKINPLAFEAINNKVTISLPARLSSGVYQIYVKGEKEWGQGRLVKL